MTAPAPVYLNVAYRTFRRSLFLTKATTPYAPALALLGTPRITGGITARELTLWHESEIYTLGDLYRDGTIVPFDSLVEEEGLNPGQFLLYNSLLTTLRRTWDNITQEPPTHLTIQYLHVLGTGKKLIHWFAGSLRVHASVTLRPLRARWETDRGQQYTEKEWTQILESPTKVPRNARFKLIQFYIIHRAYLTPEKINRYFHKTDATCPRCDKLDADLLHMFWYCPRVRQYWLEITTKLSHCTERQVTHTWEMCILGLMHRDKKHKATSRFIDLGLLTAKRLITKRWKSPEPPSATAWAMSMTNWAQAESAALHTEDTNKLRKYPIAENWDAILSEFKESTGTGEQALTETQEHVGSTPPLR